MKKIHLIVKEKLFLSNYYFKFKKKKKEKKRKFFDGLILYSNLNKVIEITDKIKRKIFCALTENEFNVCKKIGEFITLQNLI